MSSPFSPDRSSWRRRDGKRYCQIDAAAVLVLKDRLTLAFLDAQQAGSKDSLRTFWLKRPAEFQSSEIGQFSQFAARVKAVRDAAVKLQGPPVAGIAPYLYDHRATRDGAAGA